MKIAVSGSTGLIGTALIKNLKSQGHDIVRIARPGGSYPPGEEVMLMDHKTRSIDQKKLDECDIVIHLAGAGIADKRWTDDYKSEILLSRVESTKFLSEALAVSTTPPKLFICASAIGYYGNADADVTFDENSSAGRGFLADVCHQWEAATQTASERGIRVVNLRISAVLSRKGGAIAKMWMPFIMGVGGKLGDGKQMFSWIALDEIPRIIDYIIENELLMGPVNATAPNPVSNAEFTKVFGSVIKRPTIFPVPAFGARLLFGEMADAMLLSGSRVVPKKLLDAGYTFKYGELGPALKASL